MFGIPLVIVFGLAAWFSWRRGHRHGLVLFWGVLFGVFLGSTGHAVVSQIATSGAAGIESGVKGAANGVTASLR